MSSYSDSELEQALRRAFVDNHADFIMISSRRQAFQLASAQYGIDKGWIYGQYNEVDQQSTVWVGRLTVAGRQHFALQSPNPSGIDTGAQAQDEKGK